jgi:hypothetical protein
LHTILADVYAAGKFSSRNSGNGSGIGAGSLDANLIRYRASKLRLANRLDDAKQAALRPGTRPEELVELLGTQPNERARGDLVGRRMVHQG